MASYSLNYFKNGQSAFSMGENYDKYLVADSLRVTRPLDSHDEARFDLYFSKDEIEAVSQVPSYDSSADYNDSNDFTAATSFVYEGLRYIIAFKDNSRSMWVKKGDGAWVEKTSALKVANDNPRGVVANVSGTTITILVTQSGSRIAYTYRYIVADDTLNNQADITLHSFNSNPQGAAFVASTSKIWISNQGSQTIFIYDTNATFSSLTANTSQSFNAPSYHNQLMETVGDRVYIGNQGGTSMRAYNARTRAADTAYNFSRSSNNTTAACMYADDTHIFINDTADNKWYAYSAFTQSKLPTGEGLDGFHIIEDPTTPPATRSNIVYTFYIDNIDVAYDRDGGGTVSITGVSFSFYLNFVTTVLAKIESQWLMQVIKNRLPASGADNYTTQLSAFIPVFNVNKGAYIANATLFSQSAMDILQDFASGGIIKYFRTTWDTTNARKGANSLDIVFADDTNDPSVLTDIVGYDYGTLRSRQEVADRLNTVYVSTPERIGSTKSVTHNMLSYQILYDAGAELIDKPSVTTAPISKILGTPVRAPGDGVTGISYDVYAVISDSKFYAVDNTGTGIDSRLFYSPNLSGWATTSNQFAGFTSNDTAISLDYDDANENLYLLTKNSSTNAYTVTVYSVNVSADTLTKEDSITLETLPSGTPAESYETGLFINDRYYAVSSFDPGAGGYTEKRVKMYAVSYDIVSKKLNRTSINDITTDNASINSIRGAFKVSDSVFALVQDREAHGASVAVNRFIFFDKGGKRLSQYDTTYPATITVNDAFFANSKVYLFDSGATEVFAFDPYVTNPDTTNRTYTVGSQVEGDEIDNFDCLWLQDRRTIQVNPKFLNTDNTRSITISGKIAERRPLRVKIGTGDDVATTISARTNSTTEAKNIGLRYLAAATTSRHTLTFVYNTRYQSASHSFYDPLPGDRVTHGGKTFTITSVEDSIGRDEIIRQLTLQEAYHFNLQRGIKNYDSIIEERTSDVSGFVNAP